ncbi:taurine dioxygenase [Halomonas sp. MCCC 1A11036]|uniref:Taurine dioxygenase n=1 Tax=Billgrantia zhangzhouensis TaxID=2733481 RepID=A0ABS9AF48_9GAMM|nr:TauD/TfdA family dioxygenase [Halomonas zhangzhouensis]MCE8020354.1 taurine dioxygenase [Halomonas zhangzhouensis]
MPEQAPKVRKLSGHIGAEISGLDLARLDDRGFKRLHDLFLEHQVLVLRDQMLTRDQHIALGKRFGELHVHPMAKGPEGYPEIFPIEAGANSSNDPKAIRAGKKAVNGGHWHSDVSCDPEPPLGSILYLREVPEFGGDTLFSSGYAAYEALSPAMQIFLEGLTAVHSGEATYRLHYGNQAAQDRSCFGIKSDTPYPEAVHPVVRRHSETGRKSLFVNRGFTREIVELGHAESQGLLEFLYRHQETPEFQVRVQWTANTVTLWDNRCTQHRAVFDYAGKARRGERVTIKGDRPHAVVRHESLQSTLAGA